MWFVPTCTCGHQSLNSPVYQVEILCFALLCLGDFELSQLSCLSSSVDRASRLECVRCGFESHLSTAFSLEEVVSGLVLCCVVLLCLIFFLSFFLSFWASEYSCNITHDHGRQLCDRWAWNLSSLDTLEQKKVSLLVRCPDFRGM